MTLVQRRPVGVAERALVAGTLWRQEDPSRAREHVDAAIDEGATHAVAGAVHGEAGLPVVQRSEDDVRPPEEPQPDAVDHVGLHGDRPHLGEDARGRARRSDGLGRACVGRPEQHRTRQVGDLDMIEVDDDERSDTQQRAVLDELVAQRPRADHDDLRPRQAPLIPPVDEAEPGEALVRAGPVHRTAPAVISGWSRSTSPSTTPASRSDWPSSSWRPVARW